jgi:hypothetical protein
MILQNMLSEKCLIYSYGGPMLKWLPQLLEMFFNIVTIISSFEINLCRIDFQWMSSILQLHGNKVKYLMW